MMANRLVRVDDLPFEEASATQYDLALFAAGFESRCISLSERLTNGAVARVAVVGFRSEMLPTLRKAHDLHFRQKWGVAPIIADHSDFKAVWTLIKGILERAGGGSGAFRILVDYSSMSRLWYSALINLVRFSELSSDVVIDFSYTPGRYSESYESELKEAVVSQIVSIPGMEGLSGTRESSIAAFGLGFTPSAALGVLERLQPSLIFSYMASPATRKEYVDTCRVLNERLIASSEFLLELPISSVSTSYRLLCEAVGPFLGSKQITFIPMGPKPHVLASMLVASRFRPIGCLYAQLSRSEVSNIEQGGDPTVTRVMISPMSQAK